ncbi:hypothetical protein VE25_09980 [Devosia geojensis]|uniref:Uncharacterized protein n=1 Tax=Devosia geojensis TaxID=443610 RepID=A0A0F5FT18_9HYPH|nr:hypothetical protein VE25_09980 [Devosia geojensis]
MGVVGVGKALHVDGDVGIGRVERRHERGERAVVVGPRPDADRARDLGVGRRRPGCRLLGERGRCERNSQCEGRETLGP